MIVIKNMTMPESCEECRFSEHYENRNGGRLVLCELADDVEVVGKAETIPEACPLVELPDTPRNPEDAYREDFGKERDND